jgi:hypothetical protein
MRRLLCIALVGSCAPVSAQPVSTIEPADERRGLAFSDRLVVDGALLDHLPSTGSYANVLSRVMLPAIYSHEESMGFSDIEPERFSITGNSPLWSEWRLEDFNLSDPFFDGAAAFKVPWLFVSELELLQAESPRHRFGGGLRLGVAPVAGRPRRAAKVGFGIGGLGNTIPFAEPISDFITTAHTRSRAVQPEEDRRRFLGRLQASLLDSGRLGAFTLRGAAEVDGAVRHHLEFPGFERDQAGRPYDERTLRVSGIAELAPEDRAWRLLALSEYKQRDHLFTERKFSRAETVGLQSGGLLVGFAKGGLHAALTFKHDRLTPTVRDFSRELNDLDGEGYFPFVPTGAMNSVRFELGYRVQDVYALSDTRVLGWSGGRTSTHPLTFFGMPAGTMTVASRPTTTLVGSHRLGWSKTVTGGRLELAFDGYAVVNHFEAAGSPGLVFPDVGAEIQGVWHLARAFQPFLSFGKTPLPITSQNALALTPGHFTATQRLADGRHVQTLGGDVTRIDPGYGPSIYSGSIGFTSRLGEKWKVSLQGIAKAWHSLHRLTFDGPPERYGRFTDGIFYFDGAPTAYRLVTDPLHETPYGGQIQLEVARLRDENGFFTFGFSAANFFGHPPFGNGAFGNDIALIDWLGANPNARYRALSNTDADRAFILKCLGGLRFWRTLWGSFAIFYKDGQPFGFYDTFVEDGQVAMRRNSNRGSAMQISSPLIGWREDYQVEVDLRLSYDFSLGAGWQLRVAGVVANAFDLGNEVSERFGPPFDRSALELQLPRSATLSVELFEPAAPTR